MKCFCVAAALCGAKVLRYLAFVPAFVWPKSLKARKAFGKKASHITYLQLQKYNFLPFWAIPKRGYLYTA